ncbi:Lin1244/Lin1753 domain-containing protein [Clostridium paraputrificum]|uniref:Lin1244/Lin1753 domain-containing protein n=1 Tax=Clostridium paraputrificum TaxID=29363 RepID=UPI003D3417B3
MARPVKEGLEYFPLDCDIDQDDKVALIEAQHGIKGFGIVIKLLMKIYKRGYFYEWTEKEQLLFSKRVNVDINEVNVIIDDLIKWNFFSEELFRSEQILTSKGIQSRYLAAVGRRQKVKILREYLLLDEETINVYKNLVIVDINPSSEVVNVDSGTQRKEKKSKVKESKGNNNKVTSLSLFEQLGFGTINQVILSDIDGLDKEYTEVWVQEALKEANEQGVRNIKYVKGILKNWENKGFKTERIKPNNVKANGFNNFEARSIYSDEKQMTDLERKLLGWDDY